MDYKKIDDIIIEDAKLVFKNFSGLPDKYNKNGSRSFAVVLKDRNLVAMLLNDGWNVRQFRQTDPDEEPDFYLPVSVSFDYYPPRVELISGKNHEEVNEDSIGKLDRVEIKSVDLRIRPYQWEVNGKQGVKAYLKSAYVTLQDDELTNKYAWLYED